MSQNFLYRRQVWLFVLKKVEGGGSPLIRRVERLQLLNFLPRKPVDVHMVSWCVFLQLFTVKKLIEDCASRFDDESVEEIIRHLSSDPMQQE